MNLFVFFYSSTECSTMVTIANVTIKRTTKTYYQHFTVASSKMWVRGDLYRPQTFSFIDFVCLVSVPTALSLDGQLQRIVDNESEFEQFVQEIEQYDYLMEYSATATQTRKYEKWNKFCMKFRILFNFGPLTSKILRALPQPLHLKRQIKSKIDDTVKEKSQRMGINRWKRGLHFFGLCKTKTQRFVYNSMRNLQLWSDSMKEIEGHFGAAAETYFRLFRFLFIINVILMVVSFT